MSFKKFKFLSMFIVFGLLTMAAKCSWFSPDVQFPELKDIKLTFGDPVTLSIPLKGQNIKFGVKVQIPDLEGAYVELIPKIGDKAPVVFLSVPRDVFDNDKFRLRDPATLPGGRELPKVATGKLPAVALQVKEWNDVVFYLGFEVAGVFIPTKGKDPDLEITLPMSDNNGRQIGWWTRIPQDTAQSNGGYFISFNWNLVTTSPARRTAQCAGLHSDDYAKAEINGKKLEDFSNKELNDIWENVSAWAETK